MQPDMHVGGHRHVHHLRIGQLQIGHQLDIFVDRAYLQARIVAFLLTDGGNGIALVVMGGEYHGFLRQLQEPVEDRFILCARRSVLEIGAAGAADQERVAGEDAVAHQVTIGIVGVAGRVHDVEAEALDHHLVAVSDPHRHHIGLALLAHDGDALGAVAEFAEARDVIGVQVGIDRLHQPQIQLPEQLAVAIGLFQHRIEDQRLAAGPAGEQVAVGARDAVEELTKDHDHCRMLISEHDILSARRTQTIPSPRTSEGR